MLLAVLLAGAGCSSWHATTPPPASAPGDVPLPARVRVTLRNTSAFVVHDPRVERDTLFGMRESTPDSARGLLMSHSSRDSFATALKDIRKMEVRGANVFGTVFLLSLAVGAVLLVVSFLDMVSE